MRFGKLVIVLFWLLFLIHCGENNCLVLNIEKNWTLIETDLRAV